MAAGYRGVILLVAAGLIISSIILASIDENISSILIFTTILSSAIIILYWKLFNSEMEHSSIESSSPIAIESNTGKSSMKEVSLLKSEVPDPLEQDFDIPLM